MQTEKIHSYRDLIVWQKGKQIALNVYKLTNKFPREEIYGLTSQMRRSSISIPSNIAEGRHHGTKKDFVQFLRISYGSCAELPTQLDMAQELSLGNKADYNTVSRLLEEVMKMLYTMIIRLNPKATEAVSF